MPNLLLIDSNKNLCIDICSYLRSAGIQIRYALDAETALSLVRNNLYDLVITDVKIPGGNYRDIIRSIQEKDPTTAVLVYSEIDTVDEAAINRKRFANIYQPSNFIGQCPEIKRVFEIVTKVAGTRSSVIITGETGTGKELIAGSIHYNSDRSGKPFVRVNCAALPESLLESELFGYERGAFTGADKMRIGRFEQADGGSIFLDEVADMSLYTQAKVLRVLQEREFERVGSNQTVKTDVRIISATNKDLFQLMESGQFREDLFYRLNVINIHLPPLRERGEDIRLLVQFFVRKYSKLVHRRIRGVPVHRA